MPRGVETRAEEDDVLGDGGVKQVHGAHPPATVDKNPLAVAAREDVVGIRATQRLLHHRQGGVRRLTCAETQSEDRILFPCPPLLLAKSARENASPWVLASDLVVIRAISSPSKT